MANKRKTTKAKSKQKEFHVKVARNLVEVYSVFATSAEEANEMVAGGAGEMYDVETEFVEVLEDHTLPYFEGE